MEKYPNWLAKNLSVDLGKTAVNVKRFFKKEYPRMCRVAGVNPSSIKSPSIDDMPKSAGFGNSVEEKVVNHLEKLEQVKLVLKAICYCDATSQFILIESMIQHKSNDIVSEELGYMPSRYSDYKAYALQAFADSYEGIANIDLHVYDEEKIKS